ncbi:hypothetical protein LN040_07500 [Desulfovibrio subterraneus]|jgi:hypothetical protein|uniref:hypothetical protein n=1 Tax=Desulfovibrio subterraneus TaxID=2718620 RepID=UPI0022B8D076|nr:hypothetical protein [Desulfovibrio subterraneus]WBF68930.1 hypothetical protein LN040_07500 [Desulfovibrio subterraneus]
MKNIFASTTLLAALVMTAILPLTLTGCAKFSDTWNRPMGTQGFNAPQGEAFRQQLQAQKFDPVPPTSTPVVGMDGQLTEKAIQSYKNPRPEDKGPSFAEVLDLVMKEKK